MTSQYVVEAAGIVLYRFKKGACLPKIAEFPAVDPIKLSESLPDDVELCIIHRPRYDDWSWPKGKLEANETHRHAAVREGCEETGVFPVLTVPLAEQSYEISSEGKKNQKNSPRGKRKHVMYWIARCLPEETADSPRFKAFGAVREPDKREIDEIQWLSPKKARKKLTRDDDKKLIDIFCAKVREGALFASTLLILRHGKAERRKSWDGKESDRPLTPKGAAAAYAQTRETACFAPDRLFTSPWRRCADTLSFYANPTGMPLKNCEALTEDVFALDESKAEEFFRSEVLRLAQNPGSVSCVCMHRPVLGGILPDLAKMCVNKTVRAKLPAANPWLPTAHAVAVSVIIASDGPKIIDVQKVNPIVY